MCIGCRREGEVYALAVGEMEQGGLREGELRCVHWLSERGRGVCIGYGWKEQGSGRWAWRD